VEGHGSFHITFLINFSLPDVCLHSFPGVPGVIAMFIERVSLTLWHFVHCCCPQASIGFIWIISSANHYRVINRIKTPFFMSQDSLHYSHLVLRLSWEADLWIAYHWRGFLTYIESHH
jgi:hypothetical protein